MLLYSSTPGTGKTTLAKAICEELDATVLEVNASSDNGIEIARQQIAKFAATRSPKPNSPKIVILDEADGLTPKFQEALRGYIEQFAKTCRFILTCNYITQIIPALRQGRTQAFDFNLTKPEQKIVLLPKMVARLAGILKFKKIEYDEEVLKELADSLYPSLREMIATIQQYYGLYGKIDTGILQFKRVSDELGKLIKEKKLTAARQYITSNGFSYTDIFAYLFKEYWEYQVENAHKGQVLAILAKYEPMCASSSMPDIIIAAALFDIMTVEA